MEQRLLALKNARHKRAQDRSQSNQQAEKKRHLNYFIHSHRGQFKANKPEDLIKMTPLCVNNLLTSQRCENHFPPKPLEGAASQHEPVLDEGAETKRRKKRQCRHNYNDSSQRQSE